MVNIFLTFRKSCYQAIYNEIFKDRIFLIKKLEIFYYFFGVKETL
jgi:hypothetical protein